MIHFKCRGWNFLECIKDAWFQVIHYVHNSKNYYSKLFFIPINFQKNMKNHNNIFFFMGYIISFLITILLFSHATYMDMKKHIIMSILYNKIKIEIDINNDELLKTIWEPMFFFSFCPSKVFWLPSTHTGGVRWHMLFKICSSNWLCTYFLSLKLAMLNS
jgi:hypothetical protein